MSSEWACARIQEAYDKVVLEKIHSACLLCGGRDLVLCLPALSLFSFGGIHLVSSGNHRKRPSSWAKKERCGMKDLWHRQEKARSSRREKKCTQPSSMRPAFAARKKNGKTVKNVSRSQKQNGSSWLRTERKQRTERSGVRYPEVTGAKEAARRVVRDRNIHLVKNLGRRRKREMGGHDRVRRMGRHGEFADLVQEMFWLCATKLGPKPMNCCRPEQVGTKIFGTCCNEFRS